MVSVVNVAGFPSRVNDARWFPPDDAGSIARRPLAPAPASIVKLRVVPSRKIDWNDEASRPSSQVSIWRPETTGTPWACADATMASDPLEAALSVCMFAVKTP